MLFSILYVAVFNMQIMIAALLAALPKILIAILSKLLGEEFLQSVLEKIIIFGLKKAVALSTNTIDDEIVADIEKRFAEKAPPE